MQFKIESATKVATPYAIIPPYSKKGEEMKRLPIGIQTFSKIREENYVYRQDQMKKGDSEKRGQA
jgi:hypothetical protein